MRIENWKVVFAEQRCQGTMRIWAEPFTLLRIPKLFNLRTDPFEYADITSNTYYDWFLHHDYFVFYAIAMATQFLETFKEFKPRHPPASFTIDHAVEVAAVPGEGLSARVPEERSREDGHHRLRESRHDAGGTDFVAPPDRVAVFDNDGTLWCEKPAYIQLDFLVRRLAERAAADASLNDRQPYRAAAEGNLSWFDDAVTKHYNGGSCGLPGVDRGRARPAGARVFR